MVEMDKKQLRRELMARREALSADEVLEGSRCALELIRALPEWRNACEVLIYWPIKGELDVRPLVAELWQRGCGCSCPGAGPMPSARWTSPAPPARMN